MPPRPTVPEEEIEEVFIKGGGKGGQKINKTNNKVQLKHIPTGIVMSCQATRSREQNRKIARQHLAEELEYMRDPVNSRRGKVIARKQAQKRDRQKKASQREKERAARVLENTTSTKLLLEGDEAMKVGMREEEYDEDRNEFADLHAQFSTNLRLKYGVKKDPTVTDRSKEDEEPVFPEVIHVVPSKKDKRAKQSADE
ncbi:RF-1 domain-containing protein [Limtongia smithiae]|uniref:RF-1 domain-containing protein n=1 Tax=Limtongia smithiae TaxID=1125753 RepID=UPI0034CE3FD2